MLGAWRRFFELVVLSAVVNKLAVVQATAGQHAAAASNTPHTVGPLRKANAKPLNERLGGSSGPASKQASCIGPACAILHGLDSTTDSLVTVETKGEVFVVRFKTITVREGPEACRILESIEEAVNSRPGVRLVVDMSKVEYFASLEIGKLVSILKASMRQRGKLAICCLTGAVRDVFDAMKLTVIFDIHDNAAEAIEGYKPMSDEAILEAAPDAILMMRNSSSHTITTEALFAMPAFAQTPAAGKRARPADAVLLAQLRLRKPPSS